MLYEYQRRIIADDPKKCGLFLGTGSGKTTIALSLAEGKTLVICPKTIRDARGWEKEAVRLGKVLPDVLSKEDFKKRHLYLQPYDTVIIDEAHAHAGVSPEYRYRNKVRTPKTSQLFEITQLYLTTTRPRRLYLLTATPIRSPMAVWGLAKCLGAHPSFEEFRHAFYFPIQINGRERWVPKKDADTKQRLGMYVRKMGYTGKLDDYFDVPEQTHIIKQCPLTQEQRKEIASLHLLYPDPLVLVGQVHQAEQGESKREAIADLLEEYGKVLVFARYTKQIESLAQGWDVPVFVLTGDTKNREEILKQAHESPECLFIVQSQIAAGWEAPSFRCTIYASQSWSIVDHEQSIGRTLRANNLQKNLYVYLCSGEVDTMVYNAIKNKQDFIEKMYAEKRSAI